MHPGDFKLFAKTSSAIAVKLPVLFLSALIFIGYDAFSKNLEISLVNDIMIILYNDFN